MSLGYHLLLDELENALLSELNKMLEGVDSDSAAIEGAGRILKAADAVHAQTIEENAGNANKANL